MHGAIQQIHDVGNNRLVIVTFPCSGCGKEHTFTLNADKFIEWQKGTAIQDAFPEISASDRETLISGTCGPCFDKLWKESE